MLLGRDYFLKASGVAGFIRERRGKNKAGPNSGLPGGIESQVLVQEEALYFSATLSLAMARLSAASALAKSVSS